MTHFVHGLMGEAKEVRSRMTTHTIGNHLGCVIKYLKKIFDQSYDVIMTSSIGQFLKNNF